MHLPFVMLALATSFLSLVSHSMALSKIEYARHIHALENFGQANGTDPNMATNGTLPDGPPCYEDGIYSAFSAFSSDVVPFCSSFLGIPAITIISACATTTT